MDSEKQLLLCTTSDSLKDLNLAKLPFHSSTDAIAYAIHLYTNAINSVCYVTTRNSLSQLYSGQQSPKASRVV